MDRAEQLRQVLTTLVDEKTRWGAGVVSRDGIAVATRMARPVSDDSFCAMAAAVMGAAEAAMQEWSDDRPLRITAEGHNIRIHLQGLDNDFFLAVVAPASANPGLTATMELDSVAAQLRSVLKARAIVARAA